MGKNRTKTHDLYQHRSAYLQLSRRFLARTSILSRFSAPLCQAVTGAAGRTEIIGILEQENLFVVPLDDTRQWFRYHDLLAQVLRSELAAE